MNYSRYGLRHRYIGRELDWPLLRRLFLWGVFLLVMAWIFWPSR